MTTRLSPFARFLLLVPLSFAACGAGGTSVSGSAGGGGPGLAGGGPARPGALAPWHVDVSIENAHPSPRTETFCASVPFPYGVCFDTDGLVVSGRDTAWLPLQHWADGSVKVAQAQFTDSLAGYETRTYKVAAGQAMPRGPFQRHPWVGRPGFELRVGAEVLDTHWVPYRAFAVGPGTVVQATPLVQVTRWRVYHTASSALPGIGRDYLTSTFYVTEFRDVPFVMVDWILGNDYLGADSIPPGNTDPNLRPLGAVDVQHASFLCRGASAVEAYRPVQEAIVGPVQKQGTTSFEVMRSTWIDDAQTRRYRFLARFEPPSASRPELERWQQTARAILQEPCHPLASQRAWQAAAAAGLLGGPIPGPVDSHARAEADYQAWADSDVFGTWGGRGDVLATSTTGTPRNHPLSPDLAHAIQGRHHRLVRKLEQLAWAQAMRPYHLWGLQVGAEQDIILWEGTPLLSVPGESLGRRALQAADPWPGYRLLAAGQPRAHGFQHFDHEHWSCDLLFDYWTISGDAWAREELRQLGESLKGVMRLQVYYTADIQPARAEGWCMQGFAQVYQATRDPALKDYAMRRAAGIVDAQRRKTHASRAMTFQPSHPATGYPITHEFFMPWQHGAVLWGYLGAHVSFGEPLLLEIAEDVVQTVEYAWVSNVHSPGIGWVPNGLRYFVPASHNGQPVPAAYWDTLPQGVRWGDGPLGGAHQFLTGGLHHLALMSRDPVVRVKAQAYGALLLGVLADGDRWDKWKYCLPAPFVP